jgi:hypothetical protein
MVYALVGICRDSLEVGKYATEKRDAVEIKWVRVPNNEVVGSAYCKW